MKVSHYFSNSRFFLKRGFDCIALEFFCFCCLGKIDDSLVMASVDVCKCVNIEVLTISCKLCEMVC